MGSAARLRSSDRARQAEAIKIRNLDAAATAGKLLENAAARYLGKGARRDQTQVHGIVVTPGEVAAAEIFGIRGHAFRIDTGLDALQAAVRIAILPRGIEQDLFDHRPECVVFG